MLQKNIFLILLLCGYLTSIAESYAKSLVWSIGKPDRQASEFALAPDRFRDFLSEDFGYEDKFYLVGYSDPAHDLPYVLPGPVDTWGGTWSTSGWRTHQINILFGLSDESVKENYHLVVDLADYAKNFLPLVKVSVNDLDIKFQLDASGYDLSRQRKPSLMEPIVDTLSLTGNYTEATPRTLDIPLPASVLHRGGNKIVITILEGSWILFDHIALEGPASVQVIHPQKAFVRKVSAAPYRLTKGRHSVQPLLVDVEWLNGTPELSIELDGREIFHRNLEKGRYQFEAPMPAVKRRTISTYRVLCDGMEVASGEVVRTPQPEQTPADYVDTRIGTAHSRWMIAPGPWMPFSMVKLSPDNQNSGWQAGYQPSFENIGCFSHIHEWTLGGLGIMATNGALKTIVGDELKPDEGYRSRIDKRTEQARIGYYAVDLLDYGIKAEMTATTRCGMMRFTFPNDQPENRILMELRPEAEYAIRLDSVFVRKVGDYRIEGFCHQVSPQVWSHDADQDYLLHFVLEFDQPIRRSEAGATARSMNRSMDSKAGRAPMPVSLQCSIQTIPRSYRYVQEFRS